MNSDEVLMLEFQGGSRRVRRTLLALQRAALWFFRRRLSSPLRAEDLAQETFLAVIRGASHYEPRATVRTYLYGIAMKLLFAERRKQLREGPVPEKRSRTRDRRHTRNRTMGARRPWHGWTPRSAKS